MDSNDRERLMLSTGIALVGYAIIFLLLMGLKWPPVAPFRAIAPPVSVYVNLQGSALTDVTQTQPVPPPATSSPPKTAVKTPPLTEPKASSTQAPTAAVPAATHSATSESSGSATRQASQPAPVASQATAIPSRPNIPLSVTSSAGPSSPGASSSQNGASGSGSQSGGPARGPSSATSGVVYPPGSQSSAAPPPGSGGAGTQQNQGQSQTYHGPSTTSNGSFFNPALAAAAGAASGSAGTSGASTSSGQANGTSSGTASATPSATGSGAGGTAGTGNAAGSQPSSSSGPKIDWKSPSSARKVASEPKPLVIPRDLLAKIPPKTDFSISFRVMPLGSVQALKVTPSLGYPELDIMLEQWMEEWQFQPVAGSQDAQGTLQYVIQATTAR